MRRPLNDWTIAIDLDGTLVDTAPDLLNALNHVLALNGLRPVPLESIRDMIGHGARAMIREGFRWNQSTLDKVELDERFWPTFIEHYTAHICDHSRPFPGVIDALSTLSDRGARLAICTNKSQKLAELVIETLELTDRFAVIVGADSVSRKKPDAAHLLETIAAADGHVRSALLIGDSATDEKTAQNAELPFIFVPFGYGRLTDTITSTVYRVDHWKDIPGAVAAIALNKEL